MLVLNLAQLRNLLSSVLAEEASILLVGPPGTGKTFNSIRVAENSGRPFVVIDGGNEREWKALFPYQLPTGEVKKGKALEADGGVLVIDEVNRIPPELKSGFQLLASQKVVPFPDGSLRPVRVAIIATCNTADLGVEEMSRAELDRYDLVIEVRPDDDEVLAIVSDAGGVTAPMAEAIFRNVDLLDRSLDHTKFHRPEGIRMCLSVAKAIRMGMSPLEAFKGAAARCFPIGRRGVERYLAEFDSVTGEVAGKFQTAANQALLRSPQREEPEVELPPMRSLNDLAAVVNILPEKVTTPALLLPRGFRDLIPAFIKAFGLGVAKALTNAFLAGKAEAEKGGVKVVFTDGTVQFKNCPRQKVWAFLKEVLDG